MTVPAPGTDPPGETWRIYGVVAASWAAGSVVAVLVHSLFLISPHMRSLGYGDLGWTLWTIFALCFVFGPLAAGPPTAVYLLCRPPGHRLGTRGGWATLAAGGIAASIGGVFAEYLRLGWGGVLLPAAVWGVCAAAAAGTARPPEPEP